MVLKSLIVNNESFYNSGEAIEITAQYFNKNWVWRESKIDNCGCQRQIKKVKNYDLLKGNNSYKVNLDGLEAGKYTFKVTELSSKTFILVRLKYWILILRNSS
jgi:hypothetical protein